MSTETEVKYRLSGPEQYEKFSQAAIKSGAVERSFVQEDNLLFDWPDGRLRLSDSALRLRLLKNIDNRPERMALVTFKGPRQAGIVKIRKEVEFCCDDAESARQVFESLGMQLNLRFAKRRRSFVLDDCLIELDELPKLGFFLEIEGPDVEQIQAAAAKIGADTLQMEHCSYARKVSEYLAEFESNQLLFD